MPGGKKGGNKKGGDNQQEFKFNFNGDGEEGRKSVLDLAGKDANLLPLMQGKLNSLIGKSSGYLETLPQAVQGRVRALKKLHQDRNEIDAEYKKELAELMAKFQKRIQPLYDRRSQIVKGEIEPSKEELDFVEKKEEAGKDEPAPVKTEPKEESDEDKNVKGIPQFWLQAFKHHDVFMDMVTERDEEALKHLIDLKSYPVEGEPDGAFVLEFHFSPNEYFEDAVLKKTYHVDEEPLSGEIMFKNVEATEIKWKTGKNLTVKLVKVQQGGKGGGRGKRGGKAARGGKPPQSITMEKPCESFFNFFSPDPTHNGEEDIEDEELEMIFEEDYEMGCIIREQVIATAVLWFTGEAVMEMGGLDMGDEYDDDEEGDSEGDEEFEPPKDANGQEVKPECNQQ